MIIKKLNFAFVAMLGCIALLSVLATGCNGGEKKAESTTESVTTVKDSVIMNMPDSEKMDSAVPMPIKTVN